ncbi:MAG: hypothetical protein GC147_01900 [Porphyrobacter sp.]|nr:hypothetical protein [Porphyrobacter sp.]
MRRGWISAPALALVLAAVVPLAVTPAAKAATETPGSGITLQGDPATRAAERERLLAALAAAKDESEARIAADAVWRFWFRAPTPEAGELMSRAMERRKLYDNAGGVEILDELLKLAPDWAEAWNQRATLRFLMEDFDGSLSDCEKVLELEPKHFGALAGQALILFRQGRVEAAQTALRKAIAIDAFIPERALLVEPKTEGKEI